MSLQDLPPELLLNVISHLPTARAVSHLSQVNRAARAIVEKDGWRVFVISRFPSIAVTGDQRAAARFLTSSSRSWDRRAVLARYLEPNRVFSYASRSFLRRWLQPVGQTMGFQPVIDSYYSYGPTMLDEQREMLAWSAGAEILLRIRPSRLGQITPAQGECWLSFKPPDSHEGLDDVTALKLLTNPYRFRNQVSNLEQQLIMGTASGKLSFVSLKYPSSNGVSDTCSSSRFETDGRTVRSADISPKQDLLACALGEKGSLALYYIPDDITVLQDSNPISEKVLVPDGLSMRVWSTRFLSCKSLAVGLGPSSKPVQVFEITPWGISKDPIRKFGLDCTPWACNDRVQVALPEESIRPRSSSVYPIEPLGAPDKGQHAPGDVLLSGGYDGVIRLHDMRSPAAYESCYSDPTDESAIYSLIAHSRERLVAGTARHNMIKFFDLRVTGGRNYWYNESKPDDDMLGWNLFLNSQTRASSTTGGRRPRRRGWQRNPPAGNRESPVYALSSPSPASSVIYAGVEHEVVQMDMASSQDTWDTYREHRSILTLAMYEQSSDGSIPLRIQGHWQQRPRGSSLPGYDELWIDSRSLPY